MTPATSSSGLVSNPIPQQPCNPPQRDDWDLLFQPMFDEYFNPPTIAISPVLVANAPRADDLADSSVSMFDARHELCILEFVSDMNACSKSKSVEKSKKKEEWKPTGKMFTKIRYNWILTGRTFTLVGNACPLTRITTTNEVPFREPIPLELTNFVHKFLITIKFSNDHITKIMGYDDYQIGNVIISRVYYVEGLGHNLFSVGYFCDSDLEVAFRKHTCFVQNLEGVDLLLGSQETNLYTLSIGDMMASSPIFLLSKASKTKSDYGTDDCHI
ncbi:hypothetical protein Tco_0273793 [Tanacetum coccineum]